MKTSLFMLTISLAIALTNTAAPLSCVKLLKDDYQLFYYMPEVKVIEIDNAKITLPNNSEATGKIMTSVCGNVFVPPICDTNVGEAAKLVFIHENQGNCIVIKDNNFWNTFIAPAETNEQKIVLEQDNSLPFVQNPSEYKVDYEFICDKLSNKTDFTYNYNPNEKKFTIMNSSMVGCGIRFDFLRVLQNNKLLTAIVFTLTGFLLCFFGLKLFRDFILFFIPLLILILGFYFYISMIEVSTNQNARVMLIFFLILCIMVITTLAIVFSSVIFMVISVLAGMQLGTMLHAFLATKFIFFENPMTKYIPIVLVSLLLFAVYWKFKEYFIILSTAVLGAFSLIISLSYYGLTEYDFLFNIEVDKFVNIKQQDDSFQKLIILFGLLFVLGCSVQYLLFKRNEEDKKYGNDDLRIDLKLAP